MTEEDKPAGAAQLDFNQLLTRRPAADQAPEEPPVARPAEEPRTFGVAELVRLASRKLQASFGDVWVEGEVSNASHPRSGHVYFTLKEDRAQLQVVMFKPSARRLKFRIEDGQQLRCRGRLGIYEVQGRFQLTAEVAEPTGVGALQLAFEQLKARLEAEGLFDPRHKKPLPRLPRTIAVVTSPTGAAVRDIIRVLHRRCPVRIVVCPTPVQGAEAPAAIVEALRRADRLGADLIIAGRGGGSLEDLWAFNEEAVARAIFACATPVISAVGHEVDVTIADLVADRRAPTPSGAAELAVPVMDELRQQLQVQQLRLARAARHRLGEGRLALERLGRRLGSPESLLNRSRQQLDDLAGRLEAALQRELARRAERLQRLRTRLAIQEPRVRLARLRALLVQQDSRLRVALRAALERRRGALEQAAARLRALSPLAILERGYAVVLDRGQQLVRAADALRAGDPLQIRFHRGSARCTVDSVHPATPEPGEE